MQDSTAKARRWTLICALLGAIYAVPVVFAVWSNFPTERQINADTALNAVIALQQSDDKYNNLTAQALRRRLYRGLSDEEVTARVREQAAQEEERIGAQLGKSSLDPAQLTVETFKGSVLDDQTTSPSALPLHSQLSIAMNDVDRARVERIAALKGQQVKAIVSGVFAWLVPLLALYFLGPLLWAQRRKRVRRI
jgi:hypothetical protein